MSEQTGLAVGGYSRDQVELIKRVICPKATDDELKLFVGQCQRTGLDPFSGQIRALKRRQQTDAGEWEDRLSIQVGIDGFRLIAQRTGDYAGQAGPQWSDGQLHPVHDAAGNVVRHDLRWLDAWPFDEPPLLARVGVYRKGFAAPLWSVARYGGYVQRKRDGKPNRMWATMPDLMLAKCAESLALRKAFPQELSGLYSDDEMGQADPEPAGPADRPKELPPAAAAARARFARRYAEAATRAELERVFEDTAAARKAGELTDEDVEALKPVARRAAGRLPAKAEPAAEPEGRPA